MDGVDERERERREIGVMVVLEGSVGNIRMKERERKKRKLGARMERKGREGTALHLMSRKFRVNKGFVFFCLLITAFVAC